MAVQRNRSTSWWLRDGDHVIACGGEGLGTVRRNRHASTLEPFGIGESICIGPMFASSLNRLSVSRWAIHVRSESLVKATAVTAPKSEPANFERSAPELIFHNLARPALSPVITSLPSGLKAAVVTVAEPWLNRVSSTPVLTSQVRAVACAGRGIHKTAAPSLPAVATRFSSGLKATRDITAARAGSSRTRVCQKRQPGTYYPATMCRSIKTLRTRDVPASDEEIRAAALQFVRKVSGFRQPSARNAEAFESAVDDVQFVCKRLLESITRTAVA